MKLDCMTVGRNEMNDILGFRGGNPLSPLSTITSSITSSDAKSNAFSCDRLMLLSMRLLAKQRVVDVHARIRAGLPAKYANDR